MLVFSRVSVAPGVGDASVFSCRRCSPGCVMLVVSRVTVAPGAGDASVFSCRRGPRGW
jgi:hypothetical protein